jgi:hypothetical protein
VIRIGRNVIIAGVTVLALATGSSIATAAVMSSSSPSPVDSSGVIHGCWTSAGLNGSHVFVLQNAGTSCPRGTTAISWNERGPAGATGPSGPAGPTGPAGPSGPAGPTGPAGSTGSSASAGPTTAGPGGLDVTVVTDGDSYIGTQYDVAAAECPASAPYVLGGSAVSVPPAGSLTVSEPYNFTTSTVATGAEVSGDVYGWQAEIPQGSQSTDTDGGLFVYAVCSA